MRPFHLKPADASVSASVITLPHCGWLSLPTSRAASSSVMIGRSAEDTADAEARRIGEVVAAIAAAARGDPRVDAVLLGGSIGRGEATIEHREAGVFLRSDVEVYLVGSSSALRRTAVSLSQQLSLDTGQEVSVAWLHPGRLENGRAKNLSWRPSRTIQLYELEAGHRLIVGTEPAIRRIDPRQLPLAEGIRLILNRFAEASPQLAGGTADAGRWLDKVLMAAGDTILLADGSYTVSYRERLERLRSVEPSWDLPSGWLTAVVGAYERKLQGSTAAPDAAQAAAISSEVLRWAVDEALGHRVTDWAAFPDAFARLAGRHEPLLRYLLPVGPSAIYESFVVLIRAQLAGQRIGWRALVQALSGHPMSLWLQATSVPIFLGIVRDDASLLTAAGRSLVRAGIPRRLVETHRSAGELSALLLRYWQVST